MTRYGVIGVVLNLAAYLLYLAVTALGTEPKRAMTIVYAIGLLASFWLNRKVTFRHFGRAHLPFIRFLLAHVLGYGLNFTGLYLGVDVYGFPHQGVQALMIVIVAVVLFIVQKTWVFRPPGRDAT